jgi:hypothetical protein
VVDAHGPWQFPPPPPTVLRLPRPVAQGQHGACNSALHTVVAHHRYLSFERLLSVLGCSSVHVYDKSESGLLAANAAAAQCNVYRVPNVGCAQPCYIIFLSGSSTSSSAPFGSRERAAASPRHICGTLWRTTTRCQSTRSLCRTCEHLRTLPRVK